MTYPDLSFLFVEPFLYAVTFHAVMWFGLLFGWLLVKGPSWWKAWTLNLSARREFKKMPKADQLRIVK